MAYRIQSRIPRLLNLAPKLPAVLNTSEYRKKKYRAPIYGAKGGIPSKNFTDQVWVQDQETLLNQEGADSAINSGGAAMTAFARMQFTTMGDAERQRLRSQLLQYCELDTLARVLIWEAWREWFAES